MWVPRSWLLLAGLTAFSLPAPREAEAAWGGADLRALAAARAAAPFVSTDAPLPRSLAFLNYDALNCIEFDERQGIWRGADSPYRLMMYHLGGTLLTHGVALHVIEDGQVRAVPFQPRYFLYHQVPVDVREFPESMNFAGFRVLGALNRPDRFDEVLSFLGASYFRALGKGHVYGTSARGLALNPAYGGPEEFPRFVAFWVEKPARLATNLTVYALLDSPSVCGAYTFCITPGSDTVMRVQASLFARQPLEHYGLGALTSMFWYGENSTNRFGDFRPEVHDADGLLLSRADGTWTWRPLRNDTDTHETMLADSHPRGFGLLQRDRHFTSYQDLGAHYECRPSVWVEPVGNWGDGSIRLVELPTCNEYGDNVVAYWQPAQRLVPGSPLDASWILHWYTENPAWPPLARCVNTFASGNRVLLDFAGANLPTDPEAPPLAAVTVDAGRISGVHLVRNAESGGWRLGFIVTRTDASQPAALQAVLRDGAGQALSETWTYQLTP